MILFFIEFKNILNIYSRSQIEADLNISFGHPQNELSIQDNNDEINLSFGNHLNTLSFVNAIESDTTNYFTKSKLNKCSISY